MAAGSPAPCSAVPSWLASPGDVDARLRDALVVCWRDVANAGGAVGFPFVPVADAEVREAVDAMVAGLRPGLVELLVILGGPGDHPAPGPAAATDPGPTPRTGPAATPGPGPGATSRPGPPNSLDPRTTRRPGPAELLGWLVLHGNEHPLVAHWATLLRVQTAPAHRGRGVGRALLAEAARRARDGRGLRQLHIEVRGGMGLEGFYAPLGWRVVGAWPGALRLGDGDLRDEVLMVLPLT